MKNKGRKGIQYLPFMTLVLLCTLMLCTVSAQAAAVKLNKTKLTLTLGKTYALKLKGTTAKPAWKSTKKSVASVNSKGVVKAVYPGTATVRAKLRGKTYSCKVTVKNVDAKAKTLKFQTTDNGVFIKGVSSANISFKLNKTSARVVVYVKSASGSTVYTKIYNTCKANTAYKFSWNGRDTKGRLVPDGTYSVVVKAGKTMNPSKTLVVRSQEFAGGTGSRNNPFQVASLAQFQNIPKYNGYYFKQTANIDGGSISTISGIFSEDNPFVGNYNGNGFNIQNLIIQDSSKDGIALFGGVGEKGVVKNVTMKKVNVIGNGRTAGLVRWNAGTLENCTVSECNLAQNSYGAVLGGLCDVNEESGLIVNCRVADSHLSIAYKHNLYIAGLCVDNYGKIMDCQVNTTEISYEPLEYFAECHAAGLVRWNKGSMFNCGAVQTTVVKRNGSAMWEHNAGVCQLNEGIITGCSFIGTADVQGCEDNKGTFLP